MENVTFVTALYNIQRETQGDGRKWTDYLEWFRETLRLPFPMMVFVPSELEAFVKEHRTGFPKTMVVIQELEEIPYAYLAEKMASILASPEYQGRIQAPQRVECKLPFYSLVQFSKFKWLRKAVTLNPFDSEYFYWIDAGISRFIPNIPVRTFVKELRIPKKKLHIQCNYEHRSYQVTENYLWEAQCLLCGTSFGGDKEALMEIDELVEGVLRKMVGMNLSNNEQIALGYIEKRHPRLFHLVLNDSGKHLCLFDKFFVVR